MLKTFNILSVVDSSLHDLGEFNSNQTYELTDSLNGTKTKAKSYHLKTTSFKLFNFSCKRYFSNHYITSLYSYLHLQVVTVSLHIMKN